MSVGELPNDKSIPRGRFGRYAVLLGSVVTLPTIGFIAGRIVTDMFTYKLADNSLPVNIGGLIGFGIATVGFMALKHRFFVTNTTTGILVTTDAIKSILGNDDIFVAYGPGGPYVSYPWERRSAENNISIKTATNEFSFSIQCKDGTVNGKGSYRLRPDHENPRRFQTGAAAVADDLKDLILGFLISKIGPMKIAAVLKGIAVLNTQLKVEFEGDDTDTKTLFEQEHGVYVVDVTLSSLLPSAEVQRTMSGLTEAGVVATGARMILGFTSQKKMQEALDSGKITQADRNVAINHFKAISGNMEGTNVTRFEIDLSASGIEKDTAEGLVALLRNTPPEVLAGLVAKTTKGAQK